MDSGDRETGERPYDGYEEYRNGRKISGEPDRYGLLGVAPGRGPVRDVPELSDGEGSAGFGVFDRMV